VRCCWNRVSNHWEITLLAAAARQHERRGRKLVERKLAKMNRTLPVSMYFFFSSG